MRKLKEKKHCNRDIRNDYDEKTQRAITGIYRMNRMGKPKEQ
jgi:hypothetical protein